MDFTEKKMYYLQQQQAELEERPADDEIWYWADEQQTLYSTSYVTEHTFNDGKGILKIKAGITSCRNMVDVF